MYDEQGAGLYYYASMSAVSEGRPSPKGSRAESQNNAKAGKDKEDTVLGDGVPPGAWYALRCLLQNEAT